MQLEEQELDREDKIMGKIVTIKTTGDFNHITKFLNFISGSKYIEDILKRYGEKGCKALEEATPEDTGETANSWSFETYHDSSRCRITWHNSKMAGGVPLVILIQYGHATKNGGFVQGVDFINPALKPVFDKILEEVWREVVNA